MTAETHSQAAAGGGGDRATAAVTWLGHATVVVDLDGERVVTDPVLRRRIVHLRRDRAAPAPEGATAVLLSHLHYDHLDLPSLRSFARELPVALPRGGAKLLRGFADVRETGPGESLRLGRLTVETVEAEHEGRRRPGGARGPAVGYVLRGSRSVYFAGDTDLFAGMAAFAPLDVALLPVAGWGKKLGPGHLDPQRAAAALALLRPAVAVPIHWGTYRSGRHPGGASAAPAEAFAAAAAQLAPEVDVRILAVEETLALDPETPASTR
jgi:L-ascorbate metabolism protein UlaG (beta-lactamase superfamily)